MQNYPWVHVHLRKKERQQIAGILNKGRDSVAAQSRLLSVPLTPVEWRIGGSGTWIVFTLGPF